MRIRTLATSSSALWVIPLAVAIPLFYYTGADYSGVHGWAPTVVSDVEESVTASSYAVAAALGVWESGRLRRAGIWNLAPARSRYRVAAEILAPVVVLAWLMHIVVIAYAAFDSGVVPTLDSLRLLLVSFPLCAGYAVIGFTVGRYVWRVLAAPLLGAAVWFVVSAAWSLDTAWPRHLSGLYPEELGFGQIAAFGTLLPHLLAAGAVAVACGLLWTRWRGRLGIVLAVVVAVAGPLGAYAVVRDNGFAPHVLSGRAPTTCVGTQPQVCMPSATAGQITGVRKEVVTTFQRLDAAGVPVQPSLVTDVLQSGRDRRTAADQSVMRVPLTATASHPDRLRLALVKASVRLPCNTVDLPHEQEITLWAADAVGVGQQYLAELRQGYSLAGSHAPTTVEKIRSDVDAVRARPIPEQQAWFRQSVSSACEKKR